MAGRTALVLAALALVLVCESKFAQHDAAEELTPDNFKSKVINGKEVNCSAMGSADADLNSVYCMTGVGCRFLRTLVIT